jgi:superfamily I DNA and/or RNA helicase
MATQLLEEKNLLQDLLKMSSSKTPEEAATLQRKISACRDRIRNYETDLIRRVIQEAQVICATCIGSGHEILDNFNFSIVLIDGMYKKFLFSTFSFIFQIY